MRMRVHWPSASAAEKRPGQHATLRARRRFARRSRRWRPHLVRSISWSANSQRLARRVAGGVQAAVGRGALRRHVVHQACGPRDDLASLSRKRHNVGSTEAHQGNIGNIAYGTAKAGLLHFTRSAAMELAEFGIRVNSLSPTGTDPAEGVERAAAWGVPWEQGLKAPARADTTFGDQGVPLGRRPSPRHYEGVRPARRGEQRHAPGAVRESARAGAAEIETPCGGR
jgi:NAD(P)-dependent dehydrogenase (short-subunit alcohol dehydrogenase family)